ncbi:MAG: allantoicase [Actinobacteria bacterium]|nr:allantoicase [Actinomycetota bacterium]
MSETGLKKLGPDLAARRLGAEVLEANDEFFAPKENLLKPEKPTFDPHAYTDRGKEMDGWETRRRREPGHDWCIVRLGIPGIVRVVVVDTSFFTGNFPERCSIEGAVTSDDMLADAEWVELVPESALEGDSRNVFSADWPLRVTHLRLNIFPDGGVARLRVHGAPVPDLRAVLGPDGQGDVAAALAGGRIVGASDLFFSAPDNLIAPREPLGMHDGWETKRRRGPGHDWVTVQLAAQAEIDRIEVDTSFFKGNYPDRCSLDVASAGQEDSWSEVLPEQKLGPNERVTFPIEPPAVATHVRLNIYPDGGVARLRVHGRVTDDGWRAFGVRWLNAQAPDAFEREILSCCGSRAWARGMRDARPLADFDALLDASDAIWADLGPEDRREAYEAHPRIGERSGSAWADAEQSGSASASADTRAALETGNREYEERFGQVFLINATGRTADEMLEALWRRLSNDPETERHETAEQQRQIIRIRLNKLVRPLAVPSRDGA